MKAIMKKLVFFMALSVSIFLSNELMAQCPNLNLSTGTMSYWQGFTGTCKSEVAIMAPTGIQAGRHTILSAAQLIQNNEMQDPNCNKIDKVPPGYSFSCQLGNSGLGAECEAVEYTMTVDSSNSLLILSFAYVMQDPNHPVSQQPRFLMSIRDTNGNPIKLPNGQPLACGEQNFVSAQSIYNLVCTGEVIGKDWTTVGFSLEPIIGKTIVIHFETWDCTQSGHFGYAYFVAECRPMTIDLMYCEGSSAARLRAPDGFENYSWTRTSDPNWRNTKQQVNIQNPLDGEEFKCVVRSELGCESELRTIIAKTSIDAGFYYGNRTGPNSVDIYDAFGNYTNKYDTCTRTATMVDLSTVYNSKKETVTWEVHGLNASSHDSLFTLEFPDPPTNEPIDYLIRMTVDAENGCADTSKVLAEHWIRIYPSPEVEILGPDQMCDGLLDTLRVLTIRSYFLQHEWSGVKKDGTIIPPTTGDYLSITGPGTYYVKSLDSVGCWAYDTHIVAPLEPKMDISQVNVLCYGDATGEFRHSSITGSGIITNAYWTLKDVNGNDSIDPNTNVNGKVYRNLRAGQYSFYAIDADGCELQYVVNITQPDELQLTTSQEETTCNLPNGTAKVDVIGGVPPYNYTWKKLSDGTTVGTAAQATALDSGWYFVHVVDANNCEKYDTVEVLALPMPVLTVDTILIETCDKHDGYASISVAYAKMPLTYTWTPNPSSCYGSEIFSAPAGNYNVKAVDANGCQVDTTIEIGAYPSIKTSGNTTPETCHRSDGTITMNVISGNPSTLVYSWEKLSDTTKDVTGLTAGTYIVEVMDTLCITRDTFVITHVDGPIANFEANTYSIASNTVLTLTDATSGTPRTWNWDLGDGNTSNGGIVYHSYESEGDYIVFMEVADQNGCIDTISKLIHVYDELNVFIPNSFTPNGDGLNDVWGPVMTEYSEDGYRMVIYDRWGQRIFSTEDPLEKWDGTINNKVVAPNSVYSYIIVVRDFTGQEYEFVGHVTIIR